MTNDDVLEHVQPGNQPEILKDESHRAAIGLDLRRPQRLEIAARDFQLALARQFLAKQQPEKRRLAGAARPGEKEKLALVDCDGQVAQGVNAATVQLREMMGFDQI